LESRGVKGYTSRAKGIIDWELGVGEKRNKAKVGKNRVGGTIKVRVGLK